MNGRLPQVIVKKCDPEIFEEVWNGKKPFDFRMEDDFSANPGDVLIQQEFDRGNQVYSGREIVARILMLVRAPAYGLPKGTVILSLHPSMIKTIGNLTPKPWE